MSTVYRCPGSAGYGRGEIAHLDGCCARFALMSDERRAQHGLRYAAPAPREELPLPPGPATVTVAGLAAVIAGMQRRATEFPDEEPPGATVWVEYGPEHSAVDIQALYDQGAPYNLVLGSRRVPHHLEGGPS